MALLLGGLTARPTGWSTSVLGTLFLVLASILQLADGILRVWRDTKNQSTAERFTFATTWAFVLIGSMALLFDALGRG